MRLLLIISLAFFVNGLSHADSHMCADKLLNTDKLKVKEILGCMAKMQRNIEEQSREIEEFQRRPKGITILAKAEKQTVSAMQYEDTFEIKEPGILIFRASGETTFKGSEKGSAGVTARISINGESCSADRSLLRDASSVALAASTTCIKFLEPGKYTVVAATSDTGNQNKSLNSSYVVFSLN